MTDPILMSIRPRFATAILRGAKSHELRRKFPSSAVGATVFVYASGSIRAVIGSFCIESVSVMPKWLVERTRRTATMLSGEEIAGYLHGQHHGTLIEVSTPRVLTFPVSLQRLRELGAPPPQSYRSLSPALCEYLSYATDSRPDSATINIHSVDTLGNRHGFFPARQPVPHSVGASSTVLIPAR